MKGLFLLVINILFFINAGAQINKNGDPRAKKLNDSAVKIFMRSDGSPDSMVKEMRLLEMALKIDSNYFDGWMSKMNLEGHYNKLDNALKTAQRMMKIFPDEPEPFLMAGLLQYALGKKAEANATFNKTLKLYNGLLVKIKSPAKAVQAFKIRRGITLILMDKEREGKQILTDIYNKEADDLTKSYIGFYVNSKKEEIIADMLPGH